MVNGITPDQLARQYPRLYHMAAQGSWPSIQRHGLLSTSALLDLFQIHGQDRERLEREHRPECVTIFHPVHGTAEIRDQKPMDDVGLNRALRDGLTPAKWYHILNQKVFFWPTPDRLEIMLNAKAYRDKRHTVLIVDTLRLLEAHLPRVLLSPINSGATKPFPHERGLDTFLSLTDYPYLARRKARGRDNAIAEIAISTAVTDITQFVVAVEERGGSSPRTTLFP